MYLHRTDLNSNIRVLYKNVVVISLILICPLKGYAAAGFYDELLDYHSWISQAYKYCYILWLSYFLLLLTLYIPFRKPLKKLLYKIANYLQSKDALSILVVGIFNAIPIGMLASSLAFVLEKYLWIGALVPSVGLIACVPFVLEFKHRNRFLQRPVILLISFIITISIILAVASFIILTNSGVLFEENEKVYDTLRNHCEHPYGSLRQVLSMSIIAILLVLILFIISCLNRFGRNTSHN